MQIKYLCPNCEKEVLYTENIEEQPKIEQPNMMTVPKPATCKRCDKSYYKHQCVPRRVS